MAVALRLDQPIWSWPKWLDALGSAQTLLSLAEDIHEIGYPAR
jgi:hypothetical protein